MSDEEKEKGAEKVVIRYRKQEKKATLGREKGDRYRNRKEDEKRGRQKGDRQIT